MVYIAYRAFVAQKITEKDKRSHYRHRNIIDNRSRNIDAYECRFTEHFDAGTGLAYGLTVCSHIGYIPLLSFDLGMYPVLYAVRKLGYAALCIACFQLITQSFKSGITIGSQKNGSCAI